ncbi:MAG: lipoyl synthase [Nitrospiraceae bacterium]|nr:MAG: lipoyl synthase [Nitrospiraceae bacterium]
MRHPEWIKVRATGTHGTKKILRHHGVSTVCEEARCPNQGKCFSENTATFMILGDRCTRNCAFCAVASSKPLPVDPHEPEKVAEAALALGLEFVVITSVTRDDLADGGAGQFAKTIHAVRKNNPSIRIEVLTPDFTGNVEALKTVLEAGPDVFNHNIETVPRLYPAVRPVAVYMTSVNMLKTAKKTYPDIKTKSGIMLGLGESEYEVMSVMSDLRDAGCDFLTIGQYLQPRRNNIPVVEYVRPEVFEQYRIKGLEMGFSAVASSPLTRSSMDAHKMYYNNPQGQATFS